MKLSFRDWCGKFRCFSFPPQSRRDRLFTDYYLGTAFDNEAYDGYRENPPNDIYLRDYEPSFGRVPEIVVTPAELESSAASAHRDPFVDYYAPYEVCESNVKVGIQTAKEIEDNFVNDRSVFVFNREGNNPLKTSDVPTIPSYIDDHQVDSDMLPQSHRSAFRRVVPSGGENDKSNSADAGLWHVTSLERGGTSSEGEESDSIITYMGNDPDRQNVTLIKVNMENGLL